MLYHNSRARSTGACNCGRKQAPRDDPFDIKAANYDFYQVGYEFFFLLSLLFNSFVVIVNYELSKNIHFSESKYLQK